MTSIVDRDRDLHVAERVGHGDDDEVAAVGQRRAVRRSVPAHDVRAEPGLPLEQGGDAPLPPARRRLEPRRPGRARRTGSGCRTARRRSARSQCPKPGGRSASGRRPRRRSSSPALPPADGRQGDPVTPVRKRGGVPEERSGRPRPRPRRAPMRRSRRSSRRRLPVTWAGAPSVKLSVVVPPVPSAAGPITLGRAARFVSDSLGGGAAAATLRRACPSRRGCPGR